MSPAHSVQAPGWAQPPQPGNLLPSRHPIGRPIARRARYPDPMRTLRYLHYDVFTDRAFEGNQLAVFPEPAGLTTEQMQTITREMNFSECTFIFPPETPARASHADLYPRRRAADGGTSDDRQHVRAGEGGRHRPGPARFRLRARRRTDAGLHRLGERRHRLRVDDAEESGVRRRDRGSRGIRPGDRPRRRRSRRHTAAADLVRQSVYRGRREDA